MAKDADPGSVDQPGGEVRFTVAVVNRTHGSRDRDFSPRRRLRQPRQGLRRTPATRGPRPTARPAFLWPLTTGASAARTRTPAASSAPSLAPRERRTGTRSRRRSPTRPVETASEEATAKVEIVDVRPSIAVTKTATPSVVQNSGQVTFTAVVTNTSPVDALLVDQLVDSIHGDLIRGPVKASCTYGGSPVTLPRSLPVGESFICTFRATVSVTETDTVTASGTDGEGNRVTDAAEALVTVQVTPAPEPPVPPNSAGAESRADPSGPALSSQVGPGDRVPRRRWPSVVRLRNSRLEHRPRTERDADGRRTPGRHVHEDHRPARPGRVLDPPRGQAADLLRLPRRRPVVRDQGPRLRDGRRRDDDHEHGRRRVQAGVGRALRGPRTRRERDSSGSSCHQPAAPPSRSAPVRCW